MEANTTHKQKDSAKIDSKKYIHSRNKFTTTWWNCEMSLKYKYQRFWNTRTRACRQKNRQLKSIKGFKSHQHGIAWFHTNKKHTSIVSLLSWQTPWCCFIHQIWMKNGGLLPAATAVQTSHTCCIPSSCTLGSKTFAFCGAPHMPSWPGFKD